MAISRKMEGGFWVTTTTEFQVDIGEDAVIAEFADGNGNPNFTINLGASSTIVVKTRVQLDQIKRMLDEAWEHWAKIEKKGKA